MNFVDTCNKIFKETTNLYHNYDNIDAVVECPYPDGSIEARLFKKNWIDAVQWHMEDIIRATDIDPVEALVLKRRIDKSNQDRTDMVEEIDSFFRDKFKDVAFDVINVGDCVEASSIVHAVHTGFDAGLTL